ncbi:MAG: hypothetical protein M0Z99_13315 [Betaproteobacteria bacterium]|nr:hypothetical protein [Betaproteobacteria bacterium]
MNNPRKKSKLTPWLIAGAFLLVLITSIDSYKQHADAVKAKQAAAETRAK